MDTFLHTSSRLRTCAWARRTKPSHGWKQPTRNTTADLYPSRSSRCFPVYERITGFATCSGAPGSRTKSLSQRVVSLPGQVPIHTQHFQSGPHTPGIDESNGARNSSYELVLHVVGVHDLWR